MVSGYSSGITPNPDILCNRNMKFGALLDLALSKGLIPLPPVTTAGACAIMEWLNFGRALTKTRINPIFLPELTSFNWTMPVFLWVRS